MTNYYFIVILISLSAAFAYINHRFIKMPFVIGLFFLSTILSVFILCVKMLDTQYYIVIKNIIVQADLSKLIIDIMLGFLLFAGSLHTNWASIRKEIKPIGLFSVAGVLISTVMIAALFYAVCKLFNLEVALIHCLIFGALISPTDPIAVLSILNKSAVPKKVKSILVGESLFNDGIGVVLFITLLSMLQSGTENFDVLHFGIFFLQQAAGGVIFGLAAGFIMHKLLNSIDNRETEVLLSIAFVMLGYFLCHKLHVSGALAMVIMGLFVGNYRQEEETKDEALQFIQNFWELIDVVLNAVLFISIAFVMIIVDFDIRYILISIITVVIVLGSRITIIYLPTLFLPKFINLTVKDAKILVWGGLRGGLSIAMVLSLPDSSVKQLLLMATYTCVVFSILVQGLTISKIVKK